MSTTPQFLSPSDAAKKLGVSTKALRLYEERGLINPTRTAAGWRAYGPDEMSRAAVIVALRSLGFSLAQIARLLDGDTTGLEDALVAHEATLEGRIHQVSHMVERVRRLRTEIANGQTPKAGELAKLVAPAIDPAIAFDLPWPWGGERFELRVIRPLNYIVGPLFSGKTRLARRLARELPNAAYIGLERTKVADAGARLAGDPTLEERVEHSLAWLIEDGASRTDALIALVTALEADGPDILIIDMIEEGLDEATQYALIAHLRRRAADSRPLFMLTRSRAILDLESVGADEAILLCPANHSPPIAVAPYPGAQGYEAVATCLAPPEARARTAGVVAVRKPAA